MNQKEKLGKVTAKGARFSRIGAMSTGSKIAMGLLALIVLVSILAPYVSPYGPDDIFDKWSAPSGEHLFGTDHVGRDIFARVLYGGRFSLMIGLCSTLIALFFGAIIGSIAAVVRKSFSEAIMRVMDIVMAVPGIAMAAVSVLVFGRTLSKSGNTFGLVVVIICSIAFVYIPQLSRIVRANVMAAYGEDYVRAVIVSGARAPWILTKHVMRNTAAPVLVFATVLVADATILEASLTFIGSGLQATTVATWGNVLSEASSNLSVLLGKWGTALFPGLFILITTLCLNVLSEGLTDAMASPRIRSRADVEADEAALEEVAGEGHGKDGELVTEKSIFESSYPEIRRPEVQEHVSLSERLNQLRDSELKRRDRLVYATPEQEPVCGDRRHHQSGRTRLR